MITAADIRNTFFDRGVGADDTILVHSSFSSLGPVEGGPTGFINAMSDLTRNEVYPTFTYGFWSGEPWEYHTPSDTGILGETARQHPEAVRTLHPFYSMAVLGPDADRIAILKDHTAFGPGSIFRTLHDMNAWLCVIGLRYDQSFTFFHYVEQNEGGVPYRHTKEFTGMVDGQRETWTMAVRNDGVRTWVEPMGELLHNVGAMTRFQLGETEVKLGRAKDVYRAVATYMKMVPELLYYPAFPNPSQEKP